MIASTQGEGRQIGWRRRCRVACGLEGKSKKKGLWRQKCGRCFFFFFFSSLSVRPHRCRRRKDQGFRGGQRARKKSQVPSATLEFGKSLGLGRNGSLVPGLAQPIRGEADYLEAFINCHWHCERAASHSLMLGSRVLGREENMYIYVDAICK